MHGFSLRYVILLLLVVAISLMAPAAWADSITLPGTPCTGTSCATNGFEITYGVVSGGSLNGTTYDYTMSFDFLNNSGSAGYIQSMSLTALGGSITSVSQVVADPSLSSGLTASATGNSSGNNGSGNCTGNTQGALCVVIAPTSGGGVFLGNGASQLFTVYLDDPTGSILSSWNYKANITNTAGKTVVALSGTSSDTPTSVPEPATFSMLGTGLAGLLGFSRKLRGK